jgi:hypothetical protein
MKSGDRVVYVGPDPIFRDLTGILVEKEDRATHVLQWQFQSECDAIRPLPCLVEHLRLLRQPA